MQNKQAYEEAYGEPSYQPTPNPVATDTSQPSNAPSISAAPTVCVDGIQRRNICIAIDMSSSICWNPDAIVDCGGCPDECRWRPEDDDISRDSCCSNFNRVQSFADRLVRALDDGLEEHNDFPSSNTHLRHRCPMNYHLPNQCLRLEYLGAIAHCCHAKKIFSGLHLLARRVSF